MPISPYLQSLRERVGNQLLLVPSVSAIILNEVGEILLAFHTDRQVWGTIGGAIDPFETPEAAVIREVWEETGLTVEVERLVGVFSGPEFLVEYPNGDRTVYLAVAYRCRIIAGQIQPDGEEITEARYFSASELAGLPMPEHVRMLVSAGMSELGR
ncbi:MAG: NUDIX domain-containing protein [Armatimonadetes bacterium]|nr:NUDIX domain-containing protein [Armatimonadota bacterium]